MTRASVRPALDHSVPAADEEVLDFIRHCYQRRRVSWPEIYDDICAVAARRSYRGWGFAELAQRGVTFTITELPRLAAIVEYVVEQERAREGRSERPQVAARLGLDAGAA